MFRWGSIFILPGLSSSPIFIRPGGRRAAAPWRITTNATINSPAPQPLTETHPSLPTIHPLESNQENVMPEPIYKRPATTLIAIVRNLDDTTLFRSRQGDSYIVRPLTNCSHEIIPLRSAAFHHCPAHTYSPELLLPR